MSKKVFENVVRSGKQLNQVETEVHNFFVDNARRDLVQCFIDKAAMDPAVVVLPLEALGADVTYDQLKTVVPGIASLFPNGARLGDYLDEVVKDTINTLAPSWIAHIGRSTVTQIPDDSVPGVKKFQMSTVRNTVNYARKDIPAMDQLIYPNYHKNIVKYLSAAEREVYDRLMHISQESRAKIMKAALIGKINTVPYSYSAEQLAEFDKYHDDQLVDPQSVPGYVVDCVLSRLRTTNGLFFY